MSRLAHVLIIELPLPPAALDPNSRVTWRAKLKPKKQARELARMVTLQAMIGRRGWPCSRGMIYLAYRVPRRRDDDNLVAWFKAYRDGIADAGVVPDDRHLRIGQVEQLSGKKHAPHGVHVRLELWK